MNSLNPYKVIVFDKLPKFAPYCVTYKPLGEFNVSNKVFKLSSDVISFHIEKNIFNLSIKELGDISFEFDKPGNYTIYGDRDRPWDLVAVKVDSSWLEKKLKPNPEEKWLGRNVEKNIIKLSSEMMGKISFEIDKRGNYKIYADTDRPCEEVLVKVDNFSKKKLNLNSKKERLDQDIEENEDPRSSNENLGRFFGLRLSSDRLKWRKFSL